MQLDQPGENNVDTLQSVLMHAKIVGREREDPEMPSLTPPWWQPIPKILFVLFLMLVSWFIGTQTSWVLDKNTPARAKPKTPVDTTPAVKVTGYENLKRME